MKFCSFFSIALFFWQIGQAQSEHFPLQAEESTFTQVTQVIGIDTVKLEFSRPNLKGRSLFGEMIPWNSVWRMGANASTKLELSEKMTINGHPVPKGKYSLLSIPTEDEWTIILNNNTALWGHYGYKQEEDQLRFKLKPESSIEYFETFNITFRNTDKWGSDIDVLWGNLKLPLRIEADKESVDSRIMESIKEKLNDPKAHEESVISAHVYFFAANYYKETNRDLDQALEWMNKGIDTHEVSYFHYYKSEILGAMKRYKEAVATSLIGQKVFEQGSNEEWKWRHKKQIEKWTKASQEISESED